MNVERYIAYKEIFSIILIIFIIVGFYFNIQYYINTNSISLRPVDYNKKEVIINNNDKLNISILNTTSNNNNNISKFHLLKNYEIKKYISTSDCNEFDLFLLQISWSSLRDTGYKYDIIHLFYGKECLNNLNKFQIIAELNQVHIIHIKNINTNISIENNLNSLPNPIILKQWMDNNNNDNNNSNNNIFLFDIEKDDYICLYDINSIFLKNIQIDSFIKEEYIKNKNISKHFVGLGQNPNNNSHISITNNDLEKIKNYLSLKGIEKGYLNILMNTNGLEKYSVLSPYIITKENLINILPTYSYIWECMTDMNKKPFLYSIASAFHGYNQINMNTFSLQNISNMEENWSFIERTELNLCAHQDSWNKSNEIKSFPFILKATNIPFNANGWEDGKIWYMDEKNIPLNILGCDAWLLAEPSDDLFDKFLNNMVNDKMEFVYKKKRYFFSTCIIRKIYNKAIIKYKNKICLNGFNTNKRFYVKTSLRDTALPFKELKIGQQIDIDIGNFGDFPYIKTPEEINKLNNILPGSKDSNDIHFVFATSCSPYQDWQSETLVFSALRVKQKGRFTRTLTDCSQEDILRIVERSRKNSSFPLLNFHAVPSYREYLPPESKDINYTPYNKPFSIRHWLRNANPPVRENIIVIIDPDFIFLKPIYVNSDQNASTVINNDMNNIKNYIIYNGKRDKNTVTDTVVNGTAIGQRWSAYLGSIIWGHPNSNERIQRHCPNNSACNVSKEDALEYYSIGPPYILTRHDLDKMLDDYFNITITLRVENSDFWMAEMFGYSIAAAKNGIKHTTLDNLAVTKVDNEYWDFVTDMSKDNSINPCDFSKENKTQDAQPYIPFNAPNFIHGSAAYRIEDGEGFPWRYYKQLFPEDLYACDSWLLAHPPENIWELAKKSKDKWRMVSAYGLCTSIKIVNAAIMSYKRRNCLGGYNSNKKLRLIDPRPRGILKIGDFDRFWDYDKAKKQYHEKLKKDKK